MNRINQHDSMGERVALCISYRVSTHEKKIVSFFNGDDFTKLYEDTDFLPVREDECLNVFICFTNRSGSNLLAATLASSGKFPLAGEFFNHEFVIEFSRKNTITSFKEYLVKLQKKQAKNNVFCSKIGVAQFFFLMRLGVFKSIYKNTVFIHISREDMLGQAVSFSIAAQNKAWTSNHTPLDTPVTFNAEDIKNRIMGITKENMRFSQLFALNGINPLTITYEYLSSNPPAVLSMVGKHIGWDCELYLDKNAIRIKPQRGQQNKDFRRRFLNDYPQRILPANNLASEIVQETGFLSRIRKRKK